MNSIKYGNVQTLNFKFTFPIIPYRQLKKTVQKEIGACLDLKLHEKEKSDVCYDI